MQLTIQLDEESARQLAAIQEYTNQDYISVILQGISLYHQQVQPHFQTYPSVTRKYELVCDVPLAVSLIN
jgi:hypothetical protein